MADDHNPLAPGAGAETSEREATRPVRLRLSRAKGFDLQALSLATNGLRCIVVARPTKWGNPFSVHPQHMPGRAWGSPGYSTYSVPTVEDAVECFREMMALPSEPGQCAYELRARLQELRGHNLACWCTEGPCHADVLLDLANAGGHPAGRALADASTTGGE